MTPEEFVKINIEQKAIILAAEMVIFEARELAGLAEMPKNVRKAEAKDIIEGAIIWHKRSKEHGGPYWNIIEEVLLPGDGFKAYCADDGCRYGLDWAFVSI